MHVLRFALRGFARTPATSSLIVITLAVAIAITAIVASTVEMVWRFIPAVRTERLVFVASTDPRPDEDPIGRRIAFEGDEKNWLEIVGVAGDVRNSNAGSGPTPQVYVLSSWRPERATAFVVRSAGGDPAQLAPSVRNEIAQLDKNQPVFDIRSMQRVLVDDLGGTYLFTGMLGIFAIVALLLAAAGVYGLVSHSVGQRTREIGLRMALGARSGAILGMVVARGTVPMAIGLVLGSLGAAALATMLATCIPARRATQVDPLLALRAE